MQKRKPGNTNLEVPVIMLGGNVFGWTVSEADSFNLLDKAFDAGLNFIDTADVYSRWAPGHTGGESEIIIGKWFARSGKRDKVVIATKVGMDMGDGKAGLKPAYIRQAVEDSLRRLQTDRIDLYQSHKDDETTPLEDTLGAYARLIEQGKVRYIGVSNFSVAQMERALKIAPITSLQPPYSMINRSTEAEILPFCEKHGIGVINYSPMQSGLLTGAMTKERVAKMPQDDFRRNSKQFQEPLISRNLELVELLRSIGKRHDVEPGVVAIAWTLHNPAITAAIVGGRSAEQVDGVLPAANFRLSETEFQEIGKFLSERV